MYIHESSCLDLTKNPVERSPPTSSFPSYTSGSQIAANPRNH